MTTASDAKPTQAYIHRDLRQQVTNTIIQQLEAGTIPWQKPWTGNDSPTLALPQNYKTGNKYKGINILLLWSATIANNYSSPDWGSYKQWQEKNEAVRKGERGSMIIYYDTLKKEIEGEEKTIPFIKSSVLFNRCQLASYTPDEADTSETKKSLVERISNADDFITNTKAVIKHENGLGACYVMSSDTIYMPHPSAFIDTEACTATEAYYSTTFHELSHWTGAPKRLNRTYGRKFGGRDYSQEELVAELGAAFLCAQLQITAQPKPDHASYIAHWLDVLKANKTFIFSAAADASRVVDYLDKLQQ